MMLLLLLLILLTPVLLLLFLQWKVTKLKLYVDRLPGPKALPLIGNTHQTGKTPSEILYQMFYYWRQYGKNNYRLWIGMDAYLIITNLKDLEFILSSQSLIQKSDIYDMLHPWLGTGLITSHGTKWRKHRKMITPSFHFKILQNFHNVMNDNSRKFIKKLRVASAKDAIIDFQEMVHYFTLDVICDTAMGVSINAMDNNDAEIVKAFHDICYNVNTRAFHPIKRYNNLYRLFPDYANFKKILKTLQSFTYDVIEKRMKARDNNNDHQVSPAETTNEFSNKKMVFLDTLLSATVDNRALTMQEIYEEVSTFIFAGHDTTTSAIAFTVYLLSRHSEIQRKVYAEQQELFGDNVEELKRDVTFQDIADMKYLDMVVKESLRLYPSVPVVARQTDKNYDMNGFILPKGVTLDIFLIALGYDEETFPDPYRFDPERFNPEIRGQKVFNPYEYLPFSAGPRNCVGQKFAQLEIKTVVSKIIRTFEVLPPLDELASKNSLVDHCFGMSKEEHAQRQQAKSSAAQKYDPILSAVLTIKSENGLHLRLRERK